MYNMENNDNLLIIKRLIEIAKNPLTYSEFPKSYKEEYIFLPNILNSAIKDLENEFNEAFKYAVGNYKLTLEQNKGYGWFHNPSKLVYIKTRINQLKYIIYGDRCVNEIKFNEDLGNEAYKDLILQIDRSVLMSSEEKIEYYKQLEEISRELIDEILKDN